MFGGPNDEGVAQRTIRALMTKIASESATVYASQFEIYNEKVRDLLADKNDVRVREHPINGPYIEGLGCFTYELQTIQCFECCQSSKRNMQTNTYSVGKKKQA